MNGTAMQFARVISRVENMEIWNANRNGFSFVISYESRSGSGLQGRDGFVASWRPIYQNRCAIKVGGSPFKSFSEAEEACKAVLAYLTNKLLAGISQVTEGKVSRRRTGWLATQCTSHPSPAKFPANREFYRENQDFRPVSDDPKARNHLAAGTFRRIP